MNSITNITIKGFKSIEDLQNLELTNFNVIIGPNGAGKTNLISFFNLISYAINSPELFQDKYILPQGKAVGLLFDSKPATQRIEGAIQINTERGSNYYDFVLSKIGNNDLEYTSERIMFLPKNYTNDGSGVIWTQLIRKGSKPNSQTKELTGRQSTQTIQTISSLLSGIKTYQFHDTSSESHLRKAWPVADGNYLRENGKNLPAYLYRLKENENAIYKRIISYIRMIIPNFDYFVLEPYGDFIELRWKEVGSDYIFRSSQASDGTLRFMCLVALLVSRPEKYPIMLVIDEPELGLHPDAISFLVGLMKKASAFCQILVATQSTKLVSELQPEDIIVAERKNRASTYKRLQEKDLAVWLENYNMGAIWESNLIGGKP